MCLTPTVGWLASKHTKQTTPLKHILPVSRPGTLLPGLPSPPRSLPYLVVANEEPPVALLDTKVNMIDFSFYYTYKKHIYRDILGLYTQNNISTFPKSPFARYKTESGVLFLLQIGNKTQLPPVCL